MSRGVNKVILIGNLGNDPETRFFPSGGAVANVSIATSERWKDKNTGEQQERTEWHRVVFHNKLAEIVQQYLKKGSKVYIEGKLQTRKWQDTQSGQDKYTTEIHAYDMQMLDSKAGGSADFGGGPGGGGGGGGGGGRPAPQGGGSQGGGYDQAPQPPMSDRGFDDDIPF